MDGSEYKIARSNFEQRNALARRVSVMDDGEYKNIRNVFEHWSEATMALKGEHHGWWRIKNRQERFLTALDGPKGEHNGW
jgi:hypothetical protein